MSWRFLIADCYENWCSEDGGQITWSGDCDGDGLADNLCYYPPSYYSSYEREYKLSLSTNFCRPQLMADVDVCPGAFGGEFILFD